ncbi:CaiB/BaiF CoA-transferase family protein [Natronolimnohabitans sp. A-GB9]|uniref:CaiB/BaiF CoA transferase family protein n=1 Tax=Natronolimnohabitans sp. A-GB9 TaxID=3069757 RepID=UPI0027AF6983|nr:CaiB/BaiF CoA-transferase family protein [Natronolimnohabitans sp. A-GB9]MDQ2051601.1 CaiB/BaiF CoA-transferase family protein [Natronolimnohabitans sp. A-GB9]
MRLDDVRVLDLTRLLPGPYATQLLADLGADVIKIEDPEVGDYARELPPKTEDGTGAVFAAVNRGKRSVTLDLKRDGGKETFYRLLEDADVLVESFRPGVTERLGIGYDNVREYNPELVYCSLSGYGQDGPYRDRVGHDLNYVGLAGLLDMTRADSDASPEIPGYPIADMVGGITGAFAIVSALLSRELGDGSGTALDLSLTDAVLSASQVVTLPAILGDDPRPGETPLTGKLPWYDVYETADGRYVTLAALEEKFWAAFCRVADRPDLESVHGTDDPAKQAALREELEALFASRPREEWAAIDDPDVPIEPVLTPSETLEHPQTEARGLVDRGATPGIRSPVTTDGSAEGPIPDHGEHTAEVLAEAGFTAEEIERVLADGT